MNGKKRPEWEIVLFLPALTALSRGNDVTAIDLGIDGIVIATTDDPRVQDCLAWSQIARDFSFCFRSVTGALRTPSAVICHRNLIESFEGNPAPVVAFRNLVALSHILPSRAAGRTEGWSDLFDFSPAQVSRTGDRIDVQTQAELAIHLDVSRLEIRQPLGSPVGAPGIMDELLAGRLARCWRRLYVQRRDAKKLEPVFRSLETAFHAASTAFRNFSSLYDAGVSAVLWVSACEILARPASSRVDKKKVQDLLMDYKWPAASRLNHLWYSSSHLGRRRSVNRIGKLYEELYNARNDFSHGNPVRASVLVSRTMKGKRLLGLASTIYRTALVSYLTKNLPSPSLDTFYSLRSAIVEANYSQHVEGDHGWF